VRERLALVGKTLFLVSFGFYLFLVGSLVLVGGAPFAAVLTDPALDAIGIVAACSFLSIMTWNDQGQILRCCWPSPSPS
jgi:hypothetical protein